MLKRLLTVGLLAGLLAGLAIAVLQQVTTVPIILAAEVYEAEASAHAPAAHEHAPGTAEHSHDEEAWAPADGIERTLSTSAATVVAAVGFALVLVAAMTIAGEEITLGRALAWAAGAFAATGLATGLGLAPELPGSAAGDLAARQAWWIGTAAATALGLYLLLRTTKPGTRLAGAALLVVPHVLGAPELSVYSSTAPAELAAHFASSSLAVHAALWMLIGSTVGLLAPRAARPA